MKTGQPKPKHIVGRWHFYLKILSFQHLHEIVEKEHQNYRVLNDQSLFFSTYSVLFTVSGSKITVFSNKFTSLKNICPLHTLIFLT